MSITRSKKLIVTSVLLGFLLPTAFGAVRHENGIPSYYMGHYEHATQLLQQVYPAFLAAFENLKDEVSTIDADNQQELHRALMEFFPYIENLTKMNSLGITEKDNNGVRWNLPLEVLVSYFVIHLPTADQQVTHVQKLIADSFLSDLDGGDWISILSEDEIMQKHNMSRQEAANVRAVLHVLYSHGSLD